jgi:hypothetical protein
MDSPLFLRAISIAIYEPLRVQDDLIASHLPKESETLRATGGKVRSLLGIHLPATEGELSISASAAAKSGFA